MSSLTNSYCCRQLSSDFFTEGELWNGCPAFPLKLHLEGICYQTILTRMITATPPISIQVCSSLRWTIPENNYQTKTVCILLRTDGHHQVGISWQPTLLKVSEIWFELRSYYSSCSHSFIHIFLLFTSHPLEMVLACFTSVKSFDIFLLSIKTNPILQQKLNRHMKTTSFSAVKTEHVN